MKLLLPVILSLALLGAPGICRAQGAGNGDTALWQLAERFSGLMATGDTGNLAQMLPGDFMMQWLHENFLGRHSLLRSIADTNVLKTLAFNPDKTGNLLIRYSDDRQAACLHSSIRFLDKDMNAMLTRGNGYGLCIFYFRKTGDAWQLHTVHVDLHCNACNF